MEVDLALEAIGELEELANVSKALDTESLVGLDTSELSAREAASRVFENKRAQVDELFKRGELTKDEAKNILRRAKEKQIKASGIRKRLKSFLEKEPKFESGSVDAFQAQIDEIERRLKKGEITSAEANQLQYEARGAFIEDLGTTEELERADNIDEITVKLQKGDITEAEAKEQIKNLAEEKGMSEKELVETGSHSTKETLKTLGVLAGIGLIPGIVETIGFESTGAGVGNIVTSLEKGATGVIGGGVGAITDIVRDIFKGDFKEIPGDLLDRGKELGVGLAQLSGGTLSATADTIKGLGEDIGILDKTKSLNGKFNDLLTGTTADKKKFLASFRDSEKKFTTPMKGFEDVEGHFNEFEDLYPKGKAGAVVPKSKVEVDALIEKIKARNVDLEAATRQRIADRFFKEQEQVAKSIREAKLPTGLAAKVEPPIKESVFGVKESKSTQTSFGKESKPSFSGEGKTIKYDDQKRGLVKFEGQKILKSTEPEIGAGLSLSDIESETESLSEGELLKRREAFKNYLGGGAGIPQNVQEIATLFGPDVIPTVEDMEDIFGITLSNEEATAVRERMIKAGDTLKESLKSKITFTNLPEKLKSGISSALQVSKEKISAGLENLSQVQIKRLMNFVAENKKVLGGIGGALALTGILAAVIGGNKDDSIIKEVLLDKGKDLIKATMGSVSSKIIIDLLSKKIKDLKSKLLSTGPSSQRDFLRNGLATAEKIFNNINVTTIGQDSKVKNKLDEFKKELLEKLGILEKESKEKKKKDQVLKDKQPMNIKKQIDTSGKQINFNFLVGDSGSQKLTAK